MAASARPIATPPGPPGRFLVGNLPEFGRDVLGFLSECAERYGDVVALRLGGWPALLLNRADLVEQVLAVRYRSFRKHSFFFRHVTAIFGNGLLTSEGDFWLRQRRLAAPAFHRERVAGYGEAMVALAEQHCRDWRDGERRDVHRETMALTLRIVVRTLFGADVDERVADEVGRAFDVVVDEIARRFRRPFRIPDAVPIPGNLRYNRALRRLDGLVYRLIDERRRQPGERPDLLSLLLRARDEDGTRMTERQLRDEVVTLFLAGHETTALGLSWTLQLLSLHPDKRAALEAELDGVLAGRAPAVADLPRLSYAEAVVNEALRLYPPAYVIGRENTEDCEIGGYAVPAGTTLYMAPWVLHRDPRYFEAPEAFRPERWLDGLASRLPRGAYVPFGGGPRLCIGQSFAMMEAVLLLATVCRRFRLTLDPDRPVAPFPSITLRPAGGVWMRVAKR
jgi:cytochrome P450